MNFFEHLGRYTLLLKKSLSKPDKSSIFFKMLLNELEKIGLESVPIVFIVSIFFGAVITLQTAYNMESPLLPDYLVGLGTRDTMLLEFSSTVMCLILAGKVGSNIASELGSMSINQQVDALEIMGVNSASHLILPKIIAGFLFFPFLSLFCMVVGIFGGWLAGVVSGVVPSSEFMYGIQFEFKPYYAFYGVTKTFLFSFIITSVSSYYGYYTQGGAIDVGKSSTKAVVNSSLILLIFNLIITQIML
ncbi:MAG: ABC transporter permease [Bacteroidales bacterium]